MQDSNSDDSRQPPVMSTPQHLFRAHGETQLSPARKEDVPGVPAAQVLAQFQESGLGGPTSAQASAVARLARVTNFRWQDRLVWAVIGAAQEFSSVGPGPGPHAAASTMTTSPIALYDAATGEFLMAVIAP
jgi:hypothetical protein